MNNSDRIPMIPHFTVTSRVQMLSETLDYNHKMMNVPAMWTLSKGEGIKLVVLDTGLPKHVDLAPSVEQSKSFVPDYPLDLNGHSTHCAGIIAAIAGNGMGVAGIAPDVELICGAVLDADGSGTIDAIVDGIYWATDVIKADIISMSLGIDASSRLIPELKAACDYAYGKGVSIFAASGNEAGKVGQPAQYESVFAVAAVNNKMQHANFSNMGSEVDFAAGGVDVYSTYLNNSYAKLSGTSMATPALAAVAALILSKHLKEGVRLTPEELREHLKRIAFDTDGKGFDDAVGFGIPIFQNSGDPTPDPTTPGTPPVTPPVTPPTPTTPRTKKSSGPAASCAYWQMANEFLKGAVDALDAKQPLENAIAAGLRKLYTKTCAISETLKKP